MKKKLAILLATIATVATVFTGCGEKDISGDYTASMNVADFMDDSDIEELDSLGIDMSGLTVDVNLSLTSEKDFTISFDTESFKSAYTSLMQDNIDSIIDYALESQGMSKSDITDEVAVAAGYESADALFDELEAEMISELDSELSNLDTELEEYTVTGSYKVSKTSVIFTSEDEDGMLVDKGVINDDNSISITSEMDDESEVTMNFVLN